MPADAAASELHRRQAWTTGRETSGNEFMLGKGHGIWLEMPRLQDSRCGFADGVSSVASVQRQRRSHCRAILAHRLRTDVLVVRPVRDHEGDKESVADSPRTHEVPLSLHMSSGVRVVRRCSRSPHPGILSLSKDLSQRGLSPMRVTMP